MTKEEKLTRLNELKIKAEGLKKQIDFYNAYQLALKLILNQTYGAFGQYGFVIFHPKVASTITAHGRELTSKMDKLNQDYWYNEWHNDTVTHKLLNIKNVKKIKSNEVVSVYGDTDSIFVSFYGAIKSCDWKNQTFNQEYIKKVNKNFIVLIKDESHRFDINSTFFKSYLYEKELNDESFDLDAFLEKHDSNVILLDGRYLKHKKVIKSKKALRKVCNFSSELDFIHGIDYYKIADYFKEILNEHAKSYGVENIEDFELERVNESIINVAKKKYVQHTVWEDGIYYDRLNYIAPKGLELVRSSTPSFVRDNVYEVIKYLFKDPDDFRIDELVRLVRQLRRKFEFEADIDNISGQSSCSNYDRQVVDDVNSIQFLKGTHFGVKAAAYYNYLLNKNKEYQDKYEFLKSGSKIRFYYCKNGEHGMKIFAYMRGSFPIEFAPEIDYDKQFAKSFLSPINLLIEPLGLPKISDRLSIIMDIFSVV